MADLVPKGRLRVGLKQRSMEDFALQTLMNILQLCRQHYGSLRLAGSRLRRRGFEYGTIQYDLIVYGLDLDISSTLRQDQATIRGINSSRAPRLQLRRSPRFMRVSSRVILQTSMYCSQDMPRAPKLSRLSDQLLETSSSMRRLNQGLSFGVRPFSWARF